MFCRVVFLQIIFALLAHSAFSKITKNDISFFIGSETPIIERYEGRTSNKTTQLESLRERLSDNLLSGAFVKVSDRNYISIGQSYLLNRGFKSEDSFYKEKEIQLGHYYELVNGLFFTNTVTRTHFVTKSGYQSENEIFISHSVGLEYNLTNNISTGLWFNPEPLSTQEEKHNSLGGGFYFSF
jgi:hypothetical protein